MRILLAACTVLLTMALSAQKSQSSFGMDDSKGLPKGLKVGKKIPEFTLYDIEAKAYTNEDLLKEGPIVIMFYRGGWCPYCTKSLANLSDSLSFIEAAGAKVYAVSPQQPYGMEKTQEKSDTKILLLEDRKGEMMKAFDVAFHVTDKYKEKLMAFAMVDLTEYNMSEEAMLPVPATYVIDQEGKVLYRHFDYDYSKRATAKDIIEALNKEN